jgi:hypothetical protein
MTPDTSPVIGTPNYYFSFCTQLMARLGWLPETRKMVWHYTTGQGLIGIIESGSIFATQVSCLNDASEIRYAARKLREAYVRLLQDMDEKSPTAKFIRKYVEVLQDDDAAPNSSELPYFVACFTPLEDEVSQWRSYGGGENGYAIGIQTRDLTGIANSLVAKVNYIADTHAKLAEEAAKATVTYYEEGLRAVIPNWDDVFMAAWDYALTQVAPVVKDPGFSMEQEVRVIHQLQNDEVDQVRVLQRKTMMSRHFPMKFRGAAGDADRLPISKVIVGPSRHREITRVSVETLLRVHGYSNVSVVRSERPYQET